jgi:excisionase family DNA binding protein
MENLYTVEEAASKLKIHHETMRDYLRERKITGVKVGRSWRVRESDLTAFVTANVIPAKPQEAHQ